jgi:hypothetical protein
MSLTEVRVTLKKKTSKIYFLTRKAMSIRHPLISLDSCSVKSLPPFSRVGIKNYLRTKEGKDGF